MPATRGIPDGGVTLRLRALLAAAVVFALIAAWAPKPAQAGLDFWGELRCQQGRVAVKAPSVTQDYGKKAWATGLYMHNGTHWTGPYHYGPSGWADLRWSWKYWDNDNWFYDGQPVGPAGVGEVYYPVESRAWYAVMNWIHDYQYDPPRVYSGLSLLRTRDENNPAFDREQPHCFA